MNDRSITVRGTLDKLAAIRSFVRASAAGAGASGERIDDLVQAVDEAASNIVRHGYRGVDGEIRVEAERIDGGLAVRLLDRAPVFDPLTAPAPDLGAHPFARRPGGMGIHLMTSMVDEVHHRPRPGGGNELTLVRRLDRSVPPDAGRDAGASREERRA